RALPNMTLMAPKDENELRRMLITAVSHPGPIALRYPRGMGLGVKIDPDPRPIAIGRAEILAEGEDCLLLAIGSMVARAMAARKILLAQDITPGVVNLRFAKPLDKATLLPLIERTPRVITLEENVLAGGLGSAVGECIHDAGISGIRLRRIGIQDQFIEHGACNLLLSRYGLDAQGIAQTVSQFMAEVSP
ncbi:MAG: transketolase C-terminal domain-containing protein, partial [Desulfobacterales bacterium]